MEDWGESVISVRNDGVRVDQMGGNSDRDGGETELRNDVSGCLSLRGVGGWEWRMKAKEITVRDGATRG